MNWEGDALATALRGCLAQHSPPVAERGSWTSPHRGGLNREGDISRNSERWLSSLTFLAREQSGESYRMRW